MDPDDLHRALSVEPPVGTARQDAVGIAMRGVRNAKRRRTYAGVAASVGAVVVIVVAITGSIGLVNRSSAPDGPAGLHTTAATTATAVSPLATFAKVPAVSSPTTPSEPATTTPTTRRNTPQLIHPAPPLTTRTSDRATSTTATARLTPVRQSQITTVVSTTQQATEVPPSTRSVTAGPTPPEQTTPSGQTRTDDPTTTATTPSSPSATATTDASTATFGNFVGSYNHHTSGIEIKPDRTGLLGDVIGCCNGTTYPLKFGGPDNGVLVGTVTGPGQIIGAGEGQPLAVGDTIEFRFVPGATGPILQTTGFPPGDVQVWCGTHYDPRCGA